MMRWIFVWCVGLILMASSCEKDIKGENPDVVGSLDLLASFPAQGQADVPIGWTTLTLTFSENILLSRPVGVTLNGQVTEDISPSLKDLKIRVSLNRDEEYEVVVPAGKVSGRETGAVNREIRIQFKTESETKEGLVVSDPSPEVKKVYRYLLENFGSKIITGTMANVSWNISEAEWVYHHTGHYPALNGFDYIHLNASPSSWIDYGDTEVVENWWKEHGLVAAMWHWNVPRIAGSKEFSFYTSETDFNPVKGMEAGSREYEILESDLERLSDYLLLLKEKNIPVIWRPLHEGAGKWFWWGRSGPEVYKKLWVRIFQKFESKGLNNLIWVWTSQINDLEWYPGDEYVDIVGRDAYDVTKTNTLVSEYHWLKENFSNKPIALSEFGNVPDFSDGWEAGARWSWIMPWYDFNRTLQPGSAAFQETSHHFADISQWESILRTENVVTRDDLPDWEKEE